MVAAKSRRANTESCLPEERDIATTYGCCKLTPMRLEDLEKNLKDTEMSSKVEVKNELEKKVKNILVG